MAPPSSAGAAVNAAPSASATAEPAPAPKEPPLLFAEPFRPEGKRLEKIFPIEGALTVTQEQA